MQVNTNIFMNLILRPSICLSGGVQGMSYRTRIDEDNCVALLPNGKSPSLNIADEINVQVLMSHMTFELNENNCSSLCRSLVSLSGQRLLRDVGS